MHSMESTSSSFVQKSFKYDVFMSFKGEDTRKTFVDHLYLALINKGIISYKDDETIKKGEKISDQLIKSIEESRFYIIVFSKNYANSSWCLDELAKIMECQRNIQQTAYPVFYDVEPTEIRNQTGAVGKAFEKHVDKEAAGRWRDALKEAADLAGWELKATFDGHEAKFVQKIVQHISLEPHFINSNIDGKLVGMDIRVKNVVLSLETGSDDVRMIGIRGMGGAGKTTLARAVYDHISIWFEGKCFVENVRERSKGYGLKELQKQVLSTVTNDQSIVVNGIFDGINMMKKMMVCRKVLLVLDDVDHTEQLEALAGELSWFKPGSRIIITTRDEQILKAHEVRSIHYASLLSWAEAICLFNRFAFKSEISTQGFEELSKKFLHYAAGLPLTIKVLGSFLKGRPESEWKDAIERLKTIPWQKTLDQLELSYNGLESEYREIFLDVACILKGEMKDVAIKILKSRRFHGEIGLRVLEQKSLINISYNGRLDMHDHLEEMGMNIVRRSHPEEPNRHSRLWIKEEIENILVNDLGTEVTKSIKITNLAFHFSIMKGLRKMKGLRILYFPGNFTRYHSNEVDQYLPNTLQSLHWPNYPYLCLFNTFQANDLVYLSLTMSPICQLWEGGETKVLSKLKFLNFSHSKLRTFDLGLTPNLETLDLSGCDDFVELNNFYESPNLKFLDLSYSKVSNLIIGLHSHIETLKLVGCENLVKLGMQCPNLNFLDLNGSKLTNFKVGLIPNIKWLCLRRCYEMVELHMPSECPRLKMLDLSGSKVSNLKLGSTPNLEELYLNECSGLVELHMPSECPRLKMLDLSGSKVSNLKLGSTPHLEELYLNKCSRLVELHMPSECPRLKMLDLSGSKVRNLNLRSTPHLEELYLKECSKIVELYLASECPCLKMLDLSGSKVSNLKLGSTPHLERFYLKKCFGLVELHMPSKCPRLKTLNISGSKVSNFKIGSIPHLEELYLEGCSELVELHMPSECPRLKMFYLSGSKVSNLKLGSTPHLERLYLEGCSELVELHMPSECPRLKMFYLSGSKVSNLKLGSTPHLERLYLKECSGLVELHMPSECPRLKMLNLSGSKVSNLKLGSTPHLEELYLNKCSRLVELHMPSECPRLKMLDLSGSKVSNLKLGSTPHLEDLYLNECSRLVELHMPSECPCLKMLDLSGSKVSNLKLGSTPHLERLYVKECYYLQEIHAPVGCLKEFVQLEFSGCSKYIMATKQYGFPELDRLATLQLFAESRYICPLHPNTSFPKFRFKCFYNEPRPSLSNNGERLISFGLCACTNLERFSATICGWQHLGRLTLEGSIPEVPKDLYQLESLEELSLSMKEIKQLPDNICMLKHLKYLKLRFCQLLEQLPKNIGILEALEELHLTDCISLREIPNSVCQLKSLKYLDLRYCILVENLPEEFGRLTSLEEINLEGVGIRDLPQSIFQLKGLYIVGSTWRLESYGFTSLRNITRYTASCYIKDSQHESQVAALQTNIATGNHVDAQV